MTKTEQQGARNLLKPDNYSLPYKVRYIYESRGGEMLAFDTAPMTEYRARKVRAQESNKPHDFVQIQLVRVKDDYVEGLTNYRLVTLPSQVTKMTYQTNVHFKDKRVSEEFVTNVEPWILEGFVVFEMAETTYFLNLDEISYFEFTAAK